MNNQKIRALGALVLALVWVLLTGFAWFGPKEEFSNAERRLLDQFPGIKGQTLLSGEFMQDFEDYTLDQFPLRDAFRQLKALFHYNVMLQKDNNGIYVVDGYAAEMEYPLDEGSLDHALSVFNKVYDLYLKDSGSKVYSVVVPDKGYYLAEENGYLSMDYEKLFSQVAEQMPWATHLDITDCLTLEDYYRTDTHWRQERIGAVAQKLCQALGVRSFEDLTAEPMERPFYGVYYGQAALPMQPDAMYLMENEVLSGCSVTAYDNMGKKVQRSIYDPADAQAKDQYDIFLSGMEGILHIENPNAETDRELVIFRDSFGSSLAPLLLRDYKTVTLVDLRYTQLPMLGRFVNFADADVLFCHSTLVLNKNLI